MDRLRRALLDAAAGKGGTVVVEGAAGAGKTHLLDQAASFARENGMLTLYGGGSPLESAASFGLALELLEPLLDSWVEQGELPEGLAQVVDPRGDRADAGDGIAALASAAFARVCERAAADVPLALFVDDGHWVDPASLEALAAISRRAGPRESPWWWRCDSARSRRTPARSPNCAANRPPRWCGSAGSAQPASAAPGGVRAGPTDEDAAAACARLTGGNPLLVTQVAALLSEADGPVTVERLEGLGERAVSVAASVEARLRRLGEGRPPWSPPARCSATKPQPPRDRPGRAGGVDAVAALDRLTAASVLEPGEPLRFTHPLVRDAVYEARPARRGPATMAGPRPCSPPRPPTPTRSLRIWCAPIRLARAIRWNCWERPRSSAWPRGSLGRRRLPGTRASGAPRPRPGARALLSLGFGEALLGRPGAAERLRAARREAKPSHLRAEAACGLAPSLCRRTVHQGRAGAEARPRRLAAGEEDDGGDWLEARLEASSLAAARYARTLGEDNGGERLATVLQRHTVGESASERALLAELAIELRVRGKPREQVVSLAIRASASGALLATSDRHGIVVSQVAAALVWSDAWEEAEKMLDTAMAHAEADGRSPGWPRRGTYAPGCGCTAAAGRGRGRLLGSAGDPWLGHVPALGAQRPRPCPRRAGSIRRARAALELRRGRALE